MIDSQYSSFYLSETTHTEILNIVNALNEKKSVGYDGIPVKVIKLLFECKPGHFENFINLSFKEGVFPEDLKIARITPIYKTGDINCLGNYRPISILSNFSKVIET